MSWSAVSLLGVLAFVGCLFATGVAGAAGDAEAKRHYTKGSNAYDVGDFKEAIDHFKAAYKTSPEPVFLFNIAQCYRQLKDREQAQFFYRSYLRKAPADAPNRADAERWMRELEKPAAAGTTPPAPVPLPPATTPSAPIPAATGGACAGAAFGFEGTTDGFEVVTTDVTAFKSVAPDRGRSFCGSGSLRVEAAFDLSGTRNKNGTLPNQGGQLMVKLKKPLDLTNKTVTVHVYADAAPGVVFGMLLFAVNKDKWVDGKFFQPLTPGKWWTITATFKESNRLFTGGSSPANEVEAIALQVSAIGSTAQRTWSGRLYVDGLGWR